jgi:protein-disulfide isomerase
MRRVIQLLVPAIFVGTFFLAQPAQGAWPSRCDRLPADDQAKARTIMGKVFPHDCCDDTLANCVKKSGPSKLVNLLASGVCHRVANGQSGKEIVRELEKRAASMMASGKPAAIDTSKVAWAGDKNNQVEVIVYACARCPFCTKSVPEMYEAVVSGPLKKMARLGFRIFPVKSHPGSKEGGLALETANTLGSFWPYLLEMYKNFDSFDNSTLKTWAGNVGISTERFQAEIKAKPTRKRLVNSKKEGLRNQVEATPTYFINGKLYRGDMKTWALSCAIQEEYHRLKGDLCSPQ